MNEPNMKQVWAGLAMLALLTRRDFKGDFAIMVIRRNRRKFGGRDVY